MKRLPIFARKIPLLFLVCFSAYAADEKDDLKTKLSSTMVDMPVTTAPATFVLDAAGQAVPRVSTFRAFSTQFARAFDEKGNLTNTVAAEIAPVLALGRLTWDDIERSNSLRIAARTTISFASKAAASGNPSQGAFGIQSVLYSKEMDSALTIGFGDSCKSTSKDLDELIKNAPPLEPGQKNTVPQALLDRITACQKKIDGLLTKWNQTVVVAGWGRRLSYVTDAGKNVPDSNSYWLTASYGGDQESVEAPATERLGHLLTAHYRKATNTQIANAAGESVLASQRTMAVNYRYGNARLAVLGEYSLVKSSSADINLGDRRRKVLGIEYLLQKGLYLTLGVADDSGLPKNKRALLTNLNWGFAEKSVIFPAK